MLRNAEIKNYVIALGAIGLAGTVAGAFISLSCALLVFLTAALLMGCSLIFTRWRYREIARLSGYLRQIIAGDEALDVRDNHEGELSILKNDIYKVTLMLSEQKALLARDKLALTEAISDISHQLKTPLTSMMVMTDLLSDDQLSPEKRREFTRNIRVQLERLEWLVSSLLKLSKIDAGTAHFKQEPVAVKKLIQNAFEPLSIPIDVKQQTIEIEGEEQVSFLGDFHWTAEALLNIFKNCVEHTREGGKIAISFTENTLFTEIVIADNGEGIAKEDLSNIFKRFYKGKNAAEASIGIGLAMAYSIITSQNGDLEVKSAKGQGTQFRIKFYKQVV